MEHPEKGGKTGLNEVEEEKEQQGEKHNDKPSFVRPIDLFFTFLPQFCKLAGRSAAVFGPTCSSGCRSFGQSHWEADGAAAAQSGRALFSDDQSATESTDAELQVFNLRKNPDLLQQARNKKRNAHSKAGKHDFQDVFEKSKVNNRGKEQGV